MSDDHLFSPRRQVRPPNLCYVVSHMALASTDLVLRSTRQWLKPLVHVLLSCGITWREFAELAKSTYVEVATDNFGKHGRPSILRMSGKGKTFDSLVEQAGGSDVRSTTLLKELVSAGAVRVRSDG